MVVARLGSSLFITAALAMAACSQQPPQKELPAHTGKVKDAIPMPTPDMTKPVDLPGVHNLVAFSTNFVSGSVPEGDAGFDSLAAMGVTTIISVDGAIPEVGKAKARGMRYIHLPIGYSGFDDQRKLELTRATQDAIKSGPVYIHCHHGKHRSAGAAAAIAASLGWTDASTGVSRMKVSGTAPTYTGLYACAAEATPIDQATLNSLDGNFPEVSKPTDFIAGMVDIDDAMENLKLIERAGWKTPTDHPDLVPAAEAGRIADHFRLLMDDDDVANKPAPFASMINDNGAKAQALEDLLAAGVKDTARLSAQFKLVAASCKDCHVKFRD